MEESVDSFKAEFEHFNSGIRKCTAKGFNRRIVILENYYGKIEKLRMAFAEHDIKDEFDWGKFKPMIIGLTRRI